MVTFAIGGQEYGLPVDVVREVVPALLALAGAPSYVRGLLNLRGQHLPVLDGRTLVGERAHDGIHQQIVVAGCDAPELGLLVDQACEIRTVSAPQVMTLSRNAAAAFLQGVVAAHGRSLLLCDFAALQGLAPRIADVTVRQ